MKNLSSTICALWIPNRMTLPGSLLMYESHTGHGYLVSHFLGAELQFAEFLPEPCGGIIIPISLIGKLRLKQVK